LALAVPLSRFTSRVGGGSAFFVRPIRAMKKASTWYLFALAVLNFLLALGTSAATDMWKTAYREFGVKLPGCTLFLLQCHWWPYLFFGFAFVLALVSMRSHRSSGFFYHIIIGVLVVECFILFMSQIIFVLPLISTMTFL
jgi:hypothetical protein